MTDENQFNNVNIVDDQNRRHQSTMVMIIDGDNDYDIHPNNQNNNGDNNNGDNDDVDDKQLNLNSNNNKMDHSKSSSSQNSIDTTLTSMTGNSNNSIIMSNTNNHTTSSSTMAGHNNNNDDNHYNIGHYHQSQNEDVINLNDHQHQHHFIGSTTTSASSFPSGIHNDSHHHINNNDGHRLEHFAKFRNPPWWNRRTRLERLLCAVTAITLMMCVAMSITLAMVRYQRQQQQQQDTTSNTEHGPFTSIVSHNHYHHQSASPTAQQLVNRENQKAKLSVIDSPSLSIPSSSSSTSVNRIFEKQGKSLKNTKLLSTSSSSSSAINWPPTPTTDVCLTQGCVRAASELITNMNENVSPCDDFYQFACGGWIKNQVIPDDRTTVSVFSLLQDELNHKLRVLVESKGTPEEPEFFDSMRNMYRSCLNLTAIEKAGDTPLHLALKRFGGWPVVVGQNWNGSNFNWIDILIKFRELGFSHDILIDLSVTPDFRNNTRHIIDLDQTSLGMPDRNYYNNGLNDSSVAAYYKLMVDSAVFLGANRTIAEKEMLDALQFETTLAAYCLPREERRNMSSLYNKMNIHQIRQLAPNIHWEKYFDSLLGIKITDQDEVIMIYYKELIKIVTGQAREEPRWEQCISSLTNSLGISLSSLYVRHHFKGNSKERALEMVDYIHREFMKILDRVEWMDDQTRQRARDKALAIRPYIGYPNELLNNTEIESFYKGLKFVKDDYFSNVQTLRKWSTDLAFGYLRKLNKKGDWRKHGKSAVVNAYYNIIENSRQFDKNGNNVNWWEPETDKSFKERTKCIIEQYGNYTVPENGLKVNGVNTQGENIADNGGIKEAFRAYQEYVKDNGEEPSLPGLKYTPKQLFWISAANIWCGKYRPEVLRLRLQAGSHSPAQFRVIGTVSNLEEFGETFGCPPGSPMRPAKKCSVW
ncbi:NEDD8 protease nep2 [Dermatophagoides farinae]|uniref:NEDD8 protease nep2 n=1 Tax=Dermatophagoides farinae TaxID=6954 RepID=A0A922HXW8_DERFA|nr:NEDD8 protease nep2 [Dermatophagoides farinae]